MHLLYALCRVPRLQTSYFSQQMCSWKVYSKTYFWTFSPFRMCVGGGEGGMDGQLCHWKDSRPQVEKWGSTQFLSAMNFQKRDQSETHCALLDIFNWLHQRFISTCHRWPLLKEVASFIMKGIGVIRNHQNLKNLFGLYQHREIRCPVVTIRHFSSLSPHPCSALPFITKCFSLLCVL